MTRHRWLFYSAEYIYSYFQSNETSWCIVCSHPKCSLCYVPFPLLGRAPFWVHRSQTLGFAFWFFGLFSLVFDCCFPWLHSSFLLISFLIECNFRKKIFSYIEDINNIQTYVFLINVILLNPTVYVWYELGEPLRDSFVFVENFCKDWWFENHTSVHTLVFYFFLF